MGKKAKAEKPDSDTTENGVPRGVCEPFSLADVTKRSLANQSRIDPQLHEIFFRKGLTDVPPPLQKRRRPSVYNPLAYRAWQEEQKRKHFPEMFEGEEED